MKIDTTRHGLRMRVLADGRTAIVPRFIATEEMPERGAVVESDMAVDDWARPRCVGLSIRPLGDGPITGETLRAIPVARLLRRATATASTWGGYAGPTPDAGQRFEPLADDERPVAYERLSEGARRPRRGSPITHEHLQDVADTSRAALASGEPPTASVQARWHVARPTASRWVAKARELGFLEPRSGLADPEKRNEIGPTSAP